MSECAVLDQNPQHSYWNVEFVVSLEAPVEPEDGDLIRHGDFLELSSEAELWIRKMSISIGGAAKDHFVEQADARWWVWPADGAMLQMVSDKLGGPCTFSSVANVAKIIGIDPSVARLIRASLGAYRM